MLMRYNVLGRSGLRVSELGLGTMTFGEAWGWGSPKQEAAAVYDMYRSAGGNLIDTSNYFTAGESEAFVGEFIRKDRDAVVVTTKYTYGGPSRDPNAAGNHRKHLMQAVEGSLKRLNTNRIDLLWVNGWDFLTPAAEVMRALDDLIRAGKIMYAGIAHTPAWVVAQCNTIADMRGWTPFAVVQILYNLVERSAERDLLPMAHMLGLGVTGCSTLAEGALTGKYRNSGSNRGRLDISQVVLSERTLSIAGTVAEVAKDLDATPAQIALAWVRENGVIPIVGARTLGQLSENLKTVEVDLPLDQKRRLDTAANIELGYPSDYMVETKNIVFGGMYERIDRLRERPINMNKDRSGSGSSLPTS